MILGSQAEEQARIPMKFYKKKNEGLVSNVKGKGLESESHIMVLCS